MTAGEADIRILMIDGAQAALMAGGVPRETNADAQQPRVAAVAGYGLMREGDLVVFNKIDLGAAPSDFGPPGMAGFSISAKTGEGVEMLLAALTDRVARLCRADEAILTRARHTEAVGRAIAHLEAARRGLAVSPELAAEDVRLAARALGGITGAVSVEDVLDAIFSSFCIGK